MKKQQLLDKLEKAWASFLGSFEGLSDEQMTEPGVMGEWSVKDILAHITTWEQETLKHMPLILEGGRPQRYSVEYGGIDAFNALMTEKKRGLSLSEVKQQLGETHRRVVEMIERVPDEQFTHETRFRRRVLLDTYSHYPIHAEAIREWRQQKT